MDMPVTFRKGLLLLLFGVAGTWLQSLLRLAALMLVGHYWGEQAMWAVHSWSAVVLFPLWYLLFVLVYLGQVGRRPGGTGAAVKLKAVQA
jgi:exosortase/archaeosortase family protein